MSDQEILLHCFEVVAQTGTDLTPAVYERFTRDMPEAIQHIGIMDERMRGRMLDQVYKLLLEETDSEYLKFETDMHRGYGADTALYRGILQAVKGAVADCMGDRWSTHEDEAWNRSIDHLIDEIKNTEASAAS